MIDWVLSSSLILICFGAVRLGCHRWLLRNFGARTLYSLWALLPLALIVSALPQQWWPQWHESSAAWLVLVQAQQQITTVVAASYSMTFYWIWLLGVAVALTVLLLQWPREQRYWRIGRLRVVRTNAGAGPAIAGLLRPILYLPRDFAQRFNRQQRQLMLAHEKQHWQRGDLLANALAYGICAIFWFHPVAWLCYRRFRYDQELACDAQVLARASVTERAQYGQTLVQVAATAITEGTLSPHHYRYGANTTMKERILQLQSARPLRYWPLLVLSLLTMTFIIAWQSPVMAAGQAKEDARPIVRVNPSYPVAAAQQGIEGQVVMRFSVTTDGKVANIEILNAKPAGIFNEAAKTALSKWRYDPRFAGEGHQVALAFQLASD